MMGRTAQILLSDPERLGQAKAEHAAKLAQTPYVCPMPADLRPPLVAQPTGVE